LARAALRGNDAEQARALLRQVLAREPQLMQARAWMGSLLAASGSEGDFFVWQSELPAWADEHPEIWFVRGNFARRQGRPAEAVRCLWEAVRIDPNHQTANYQLAQALIALDRPVEAQPYLDRARQLGELAVAATTFQRSGDPKALRKAAQLSDALGLVWESWGWRRILAQRGGLAGDDPLMTEGPLGDLPPSISVESRLEMYFERLLAGGRGRTDAARLPEWKGDMTAYPLPQWRGDR
jgi:tetratricopeptide (TPR) repeat protein